MLTYELNSDLIQDSGINKQYTLQGLLAYGQIDRSYMVKVIGEADPKLLGSDAENYIKTLVPIGTAHPNDVLCLARNYQIRSIESDDTVQVIVSYVYNQLPVDSTLWTIESDSYSEIEETDQQYDGSGNLVPIVVNNYILGWVSKDTPKPAGDIFHLPEGPQPPAYGLVTCPRPRKRWNYTKQIYSRSAAIAYDSATADYVGRVNSTIFTGVSAGSTTQNLSLPIGTVVCWDAGLNFSPYQGQFIARAVLIYKPEGWQPFARWSNSILGVPDNLWRAGVTGGTPYDANGIVRSTAIPTANLNTLMSLI